MLKHHHIVMSVAVILLFTAAFIRIGTAFGLERDALPAPVIQYSSTALTAEDVTATVVSDMPVTVTNNTGLASYTFTANGEYTFTFADEAGHTGSIAAQVRNIDKDPPPALITQSPDEQTPQSQATFALDGWDVVSAFYRLDEGDWVQTNDPATPFTLEQIAPGVHTFSAIGCDALNNCQSRDLPSTYQWEVIASDEYKVRTTALDRGEKAIEVSVGQQHLWAYEGTRLVFNTPVTTGSRGLDTTPGEFAISQKYLNKSFTGGFFSRYWMRFNGGMGIHDATWRQEFGVEDYKWRGSHGCVNVAYDAAEWLYGWSEIGTSVTVYSE
ncbi:hypothetical protein AUK40_03085 [Candidatus Wirthbacteria bacterium CG2_30_54_11]|uniref:L,D-TPase catalytic domain-containing protein n=1 Tax=Candidatus Wirthbacteria bacterium CG2_30_54_11 TaxID=1817892 RepID=A0A1J5IYW4_9BACT|nr:MAG: hypothetical protein AUK40_03085 [Candidatus Wirthbacteria bacterium CG2_30_54_11]